MAERDTEELLKAAAGFGRCPSCVYLSGGSPGLCLRCAQRTLEPLAAADGRCQVCDQTYLEGETACRNPVCNMSQRWFGWNYAIAMRSGVLQRAIDLLKRSPADNSSRGWAGIFGRILVGFLDANATTFADVDIIVASPTYTGPGGRRDWDHIRGVLEAADTELGGRSWPFDLEEPPIISKTADTPAMRGLNYQQRRSNAEGPLRDALTVPDPRAVRGKSILVVDDVFTDGLTLREVARALRLQGAVEVNGVTLARQPFGRGPG